MRGKVREENIPVAFCGTPMILKEGKYSKNAPNELRSALLSFNARQSAKINSAKEGSIGAWSAFKDG